MMGKQLAVVVDESNRKKLDAKVRMIEKDIPEPGTGEVLVRITLRPVSSLKTEYYIADNELAGYYVHDVMRQDVRLLGSTIGDIDIKINPSDVAMVPLLYPGFKPTSFPGVPGGEGVGKVVENGPSASKFPVGTRVVAVPWGTFTGNGTWQQYTVVPEDALISVPDSVPDESAAQFLVNPVTAYGFLETLKVPEGEYLMQSAAGSTLGKQLISLAKLRGVKTINLVRRKEQAQELLDIGADEVIVTTEENIVERVKQITGRRLAYAAVDSVAGDMTDNLAAATRPGGTIYVYGNLGGSTTVSIGVGNFIFRNVIVTGFWLNVWLNQLGPAKVETLGKVMDLLAQGVIVPHSGKKFPLEQAHGAIQESVKEARGGKVFLEG